MGLKDLLQHIGEKLSTRNSGGCSFSDGMDLLKKIGMNTSDLPIGVRETISHNSFVNEDYNIRFCIQNIYSKNHPEKYSIIYPSKD
jgi:hypothetical protein